MRLLKHMVIGIKIIEIAGKVYEIEEDNYTERDEIYKNKKVSIKNTYRKKIREII